MTHKVAIAYASHTSYVSAPSGIIFFRVLNYDFIIYIDFTSTAASDTATDDVTN